MSIKKNLSHLGVAHHTINRDVLEIRGPNNDVFLVTKSEADNVIDEYINSRFKVWLKAELNKVESDTVPIVANRMKDMEGRLLAYIEHRFDSMAQSILEKVITRRFNEEVEARVTKKLKAGGKF